MTASLVGQNKLIAQVLRLLQYLVKFGYYNHPSDMKTLTGHLLSLTDGRSDIPCPPPTKIGDDMNEFLRKKELYQTQERYRPSSKTKAIVDAKMEAMEVLLLLLNHRSNFRLLRFISEFKHVHQTANQIEMSSSDLTSLLNENYDIEESPSTTQKANRILKEMMVKSDYFANTSLVEIAMDFSNYEYDQMVVRSMWLLHRYFSTHTMLFERASNTYVIATDESIEVHRMVEENIPKMRSLLNFRLTEPQTETMIRILDQFTSVCYLEDNPKEAHGINQIILNNSGLVQNLFDLVSQEVDPELLNQNSGLDTVIQMSFTLLRLLAVDNDVVQKRLFDHLDKLLTIKGTETYLVETLTEAFTGNIDTCMRIDAPQIRAIMSLVAENTYACPQFLDLLNAIVTIDELNLPLKRNQTYVMTYFMELRSEIAFPLDDTKSYIEKLSSTSRENVVVYIVSLINLLATCAEGENRYIESINQTILKIDDLLHIINNPDICNQYKKSFLRFLLWVYLNTAGGLVESGAIGLSHDKEIWKFMDTLTEEIKGVTEFSIANPDVARLLFWKEPTIREVLNSDMSLETNMQETLYYYLRAVFPFLQVFFQTCFEKDLDQYPSEIASLNSLATNLLEFIAALYPIIDSYDVLGRIEGAIRSILTASTLPKNMIEEFSQGTYKDIQVPVIENNECEKYNDTYYDEIYINSHLVDFASNYYDVYGGSNTISAQVGGNIEEDYTNTESDTALPLGEDFQSHIACFIDKGADSTKARYEKARKLVQQLKMSGRLVLKNEDLKQEQEDLDIKCLQILRGIVHNVRVQLPNKDESGNLLSKSYQSQIENLRQVQVAIDSHNAIMHVLPLLSKPSDNIVREVLAFLVDMLFGGNLKIQNNLYEYFKNTREERFFFAIRNRMQLSSIAYKEKRSLMVLHTAKRDEAKTNAKKLQRNLKARSKVAPELYKTKNSNADLINGSAVSIRNQITKDKQSSRRSSNLSVKSSTDGSTSPIPNALRQTKIHPLTIEEETRDVVEFDEMSESIASEEEEEEGGEEHEEEEQQMAASEVDLGFQDDGYIELVLRVMAYMCDGQNKNIQDCLREQPDNIKSVNLIADVVKFLSVIYTDINPNSISLLIQVFDTLVEFGSGNKENQTVIYENKICDFINFILRSENQVSQCDLGDQYFLKLSIGQLILVLIEENVPSTVSNMEALEDMDTSNVASNMMLSVDVDIIKDTFVRIYQTIQENTMEPEEMEFLTTVGFRYFHIILRLIDLDVNKTEVTKEKCIDDDPDVEEAWDFFDEQTKSVEILKDDILHKVYFRVKDQSILRKEVKDMFEYEVDRSSPSTKLRDLLSWSKEIIKDIKFQHKITSNRFGAFLVRRWSSFNIITILLSVVIALIILASWKGNTSSVYAIVPIQAGWSYYIVLVLGILHNLLSFLILITFFLSSHIRLPNCSRIGGKLKSILTCGLLSSGKKTKKEVKNNLGIDLVSFGTFYYLLFFGLSIGGTFTYGYLFAFHLLHIARFNQILARVFRAITRNGMSLIWVGLYGLTIFYIYGLISFAFFRGQLLEADGNHCKEMWQCFITVIHRGLVFGLYDESSVKIPSGFGYSWYLGKFFFDVTAFIIITTIGLNIIFGIIVDTFSELRDSKWNIDNDIKTQCFICSRSSYEFEHNPGGFEDHRRDEHNKWSYLFYFIHLDETQPNDYTGIEMYVANLFKEDRTSFFPLCRSLSLQIAEEDGIERKVDNLVVQMNFLLLKQKEREASKARKEENKRQSEWEKALRNGEKSLPK